MLNFSKMASCSLRHHTMHPPIRRNRQHLTAFGAALLVLVSLIMSPTPAKADIGELRSDHPRASDVGKITAGGSHTCAILTDGSLWCWGLNDEGQLGQGNTTNQSSPTRVGVATNWRSVSAGSGSTTCAVNNSNQLFGSR